MPQFDLLGFMSADFFLRLPQMWGWPILLFYGLVLGWSLWRVWGSLRLGPIKWLALLGLMLAGGGVAQALVLRFPADILPPPGVPVSPQRPGLALLACVPAFLAGGWLGVGPALLVGWVTGLVKAGWETNSLMTPFEYAFLAGAVAWCCQQDYRGWLAKILRHPAGSSTLVVAVGWPLLYLSYFAYATTPGLVGLDYVISLVGAAVPVLMAQAVLAGVILEILRWGIPVWWPSRRGTQPPPYAVSLKNKLLFTLIPTFLLGIVFLFWADITIALGVSLDLVRGQMEQSAQSASSGIPFFINTGRSLISDFAAQEDWLTLDGLTQNTRLARSMRTTPFFRQLTLLDAQLQPVAGYPAGADEDFGFTAAEAQLAQLTFSTGMPQDVVDYPDTVGQSVDELFITPVLDPATLQPAGVLIGRADVLSNPLMQAVTKHLQSIVGGAGVGYIVDEAGRVIYHPDTNLATRPATFTFPEGIVPGVTSHYESRTDVGRLLVCVYPLGTHPWTVVVEVPYRVVQEQATLIATPIILFLLLIGGLDLTLVALIASRLTKPAVNLALAARRISDGRLDQVVTVSGEDEIGRAGTAFEHMRERLRARLDELSLLLRVSQSVAGSLDLREALPPILEGALTATRAAGVRIVIGPNPELLETPAAPVVLATGAGAADMAPLDRDILALTREEGRAVIENLARARTVMNVNAVAGKLQSLVALPLRQENTYYGALWVGYAAQHTFTETEVNFLTTLAGQAALAVANARLFEAAEQGRQRLAAILASTSDAVIVIGQRQQVLLLNPAAETAFELTGQPAVGRPVAEVLSDQELVRLLVGQPQDGANIGEVNLAAGKTLYASVSPIISAAGHRLGQVCVLRDVTRFKELDMMKSEFVATVSHDLRAPLTFMRGYATMLPMVGQLNPKQREFSEKIILGIEQMTKLIDDLLDLGRIEAGVGLAREVCQVVEMVQAIVETARQHATSKGLQLNVDLPADVPPLSGDPTLLRQAIMNLVDNAIKYTPAGGQVGVRLTYAQDKFCLAVSDTGVGIAPADQARLFQKFFRVKQRGSSQIKGSGLGLAIVKSIVERHGGRVWVESKLGRGSTFYIELHRDGGA